VSAPVEFPCPRCGSPSEHAFDAVDRNRRVSDERFAYRRCTACRVLWLANPPADLGRYYPGDYHDFLRGAELQAAAAREAPRIGLLKRFVDGGRMVEAGPSQGVFSAAAKNAGFEVTGLELDAACCAHLESEVGVTAINTARPSEALATLPPSRAIVLWHVIEHLEDAWPFVRAAAANLEPGGVLALATPNPDSLQFRLLGTRWVHLDAPRHVTLIPLSALEAETAALGLRQVAATTVDPVGLSLNRLGWERAIVRPPVLQPNPRFAYTFGRIAGPALRPFEARGLRGAAYTAVFQKAG
jgi:2-polyprenyl-3-methyl-5-hydroxy-6-metoxy-1,4-benzoquinol methylase